MAMQHKTVEITPDMAERLLERNVRNRPLKSQSLAFLCRELREGRWRQNGDTIRIDADGNLIDGQHRLEAVRLTGISITTLLVTDLEPDVFDTIDSGARRSAGDTLAVAGEKNGRNLAAALVLVDELLTSDTPFGRSVKVSNAEILLMLDKYTGVRDSISWGKALSPRLAVPPSLSTALHYVLSLHDRVKAERFFQSIQTGELLQANDPEYLLRERLLDNSTAKGKMSRRYMAALFIKAWNASLRGQKLKFLRFREVGDAPEVFPKINSQQEKR